MTTISEAIEIVKQAIKDDPEYYQSWVNSLAMAFHDEYKKDRSDEGCQIRQSIEIGHKAATTFIDTFIS